LNVVGAARRHARHWNRAVYFAARNRTDLCILHATHAGIRLAVGQAGNKPPRNRAVFCDLLPLARLLCCALQYHSMIKTFRHKGLKQLFEAGKSRALAQDLAKRARIILDYLDAAVTVYDMSLPGLHLHELKGDRKGTWSVRVSGNWRITFNFRGGDAYGVDLEGH